MVVGAAPLGEMVPGAPEPFDEPGERIGAVDVGRVAPQVAVVGQGSNRQGAGGAARRGAAG
jgi:hypothetical protein